jgi:hypothetical protein
MIKFLILSTILLIGCNHQKQLKPLKSNKKETITHSKLEEFIPENYVILDSVSGNINLDEYNDIILILKVKNEDSIANESSDFILRPLLILCKDRNNKYNLITRNDSLVLCFNCGGIFGDPYAGTEINNGKIKINHYGGSNDRWTNNLTFKFNRKDKSIYLYEIEEASYNLMNITDENEDIDKYIESNTKRKTQKDFGKIKIEDYSNEF